MATDGQWLRTFCGFCHTNCGMRVRVEGGRIEKVQGDPEHPVSRGYLCPKGAAAREVVYAPQRLRYPLLRKNGHFERASWDEALDLIAAKLLEIRERHGPEAVAQVRGAPTTSEVWDGFVQLMAAYGSPNATGPSHLCSIPRRIGQSLVLGERTVPDFERTRCIVLWGANSTDSRAYGENFSPERFSRVIPEARRRGAKLVVIDPVRTELAASADEWVNPAVETDLALGLGLLHVVIGEQLYDKGFVSDWTVGFDRLAEHVRELTPEWAEGITGVPAGRIRQIARLYAGTKPALILDGNGLDQHPNVVQTVRVITMLAAITGNIDVPGGNVFLPGPETAPYPSVRPAKKHLAFDVTPLFPRVPVPYLVDAILTGRPYTPRALITHHANPLLINANYEKVRRALEQLELLVVYDVLPTATAELAHVVLPAASDFERHAYGAWPSFEGGYVALQRKVIEPVGEARSVFDVEYALATRMGLEKNYPWTTNEGWIDYRLSPSGITFDELRARNVIPLNREVKYGKHVATGFATPTGKVELYSQRLAQVEQDPLPTFRPFEGEADLHETYPLVGTTRRPGNYVHTRFRDVPPLRKRQPDPQLRMHPEDAGRRKIAGGDLCTVESPVGSISLRVEITEGVSAGNVCVDFGWGNPWDGGPNVNVLTSDQPRCPVSGATPNRRFRCQVRAAREA